jgi:hypothetical protein
MLSAMANNISFFSLKTGKVSFLLLGDLNPGSILIFKDSCCQKFIAL